MLAQLAFATDLGQSSADGSVVILSRADLANCDPWRKSFAGQRKDYRFYELVEDTIYQGFEYRYFAIKNIEGEILAIQPFFVLDQDLLAGIDPKMRNMIRPQGVAALHENANVDGRLRSR